jgi:hypothetical protein
MTEQVTVPVESSNPFDPDSFVHGGGLWDGKIVTITGAVAKTEALAYGDGKPVVDPKTGAQTTQTGLIVSGISDGADDKERRETYSCGDRLVPTPDGQGFVSRDGGAPKIHANSNLGKFAAALKASGFDLSTLIEGGQQKLGKLVGARFMFKGEPKVGRDGKALKDKKGYDKNLYLPVKFVGYATGGGVVGNGLATKADAAVVAALAGGPLSRADLVRTLAQSLAGDGDSNAVIGLVIRDDFHKGKPWKYDGVTASL